MNTYVPIGLMILAVILLLAGVYVFISGSQLTVEKWSLNRQDLWLLATFSAVLSAWCLHCNCHLKGPQ